jgi:hypothetical protein
VLRDTAERLINNEEQVDELIGEVDGQVQITGDVSAEQETALDALFAAYPDGYVIIEDVEPVDIVEPDTDAPVLDTTIPADDATDVAVDANLVLTFDEDVVAGTGNFAIFNAADNTLVESIAASAATFDGTTVTLDPVADLAAGTEYLVRVQPTAVQDTAGNAFAGIADDSFSFTTAGGGDGIAVTEDLIAVDGEAETFIYQIDSSTGDVISLAGGDWTITDFNVAEDSLVFEDVAAGTVATDTFVDAVTVSESGIFDKTEIFFDQDTEGNSYDLTLAGVVDGDLSTVDFTVA